MAGCVASVIEQCRRLWRTASGEEVRRHAQGLRRACTLKIACGDLRWHRRPGRCARPDRLRLPGSRRHNTTRAESRARLVHGLARITRCSSSLSLKLSVILRCARASTHLLQHVGRQQAALRGLGCTAASFDVDRGHGSRRDMSATGHDHVCLASSVSAAPARAAGGLQQAPRTGRLGATGCITHGLRQLRQTLLRHAWRTLAVHHARVPATSSDRGIELRPRRAMRFGLGVGTVGAKHGVGHLGIGTCAPASAGVPRHGDPPGVIGCSPVGRAQSRAASVSGRPQALATPWPMSPKDKPSTRCAAVASSSAALRAVAGRASSRTWIASCGK